MLLMKCAVQEVLLFSLAKRMLFAGSPVHWWPIFENTTAAIATMKILGEGQFQRGRPRQVTVLLTLHIRGAGR